MDMKKLVERANLLADDLIPDTEVMEYGNDAMSAIGAETDAIFPRLTALTDIPVIPDRWQELLLIPYMVGRIKQKDSSEFEWTGAYEQFFTNLALFKAQYKIPIEYKILSPGSEIIVNGETMTVEGNETVTTIAEDENTTVEAILNENNGGKDLVFYNTISVKSNITEDAPFIYGGW